MSALGQPKATILVIDDEHIVHESVRRILETEGYAVEGALRVADALKLLGETSFDLVLTDLMMPDDSGMRAVEAVARDHPLCGVVMFTGFATVESAVESMKLGALDYLPKPFTPEELLEVLEKALGKVRKLRRDREIEQTYAEAEKAITSSLDLKEILNLICGSVTALLKMKGCALYLHNKKSDTLDLMAAKGLTPEHLERVNSLPADKFPDVLSEGKVVTVGQAEFGARLQKPEAAKEEGIVAIISVPLKVKSAVLGMLRLYSGDRSAITDDEMDLLLKFAEQSSRAIENAMSYEQVRSDIKNLKKHIPGAA
jgi:DNA-binding response OmpR family regulator